MKTRLVAFVAFGLAGCAVTSGDDAGSSSDAITRASIATIAHANLGKGACSTNSAGGHAYDSSCTGNGGLPEYWCADFARWVWARAGAKDTSQLNAAAGSFYLYGKAHNTLHAHPSVGDAVVFDYNGNGYADHVAIVTKVNPNGTIESISGDWNGESGTEAHFSATSHVVLNLPAYKGTVGTWSSTMAMTISGFISPVGLGSSPPPPDPTCSVHQDGRLYCDDTSGSAMHDQHNFSSAVVNHLRTTHSWFTCWGTGEMHSGGNTTWYFTLGDDNNHWGWVPAVDLHTTSAFDHDPSAHGLKKCAPGT